MNRLRAPPLEQAERTQQHLWQLFEAQDRVAERGYTRNQIALAGQFVNKAVTQTQTRPFVHTGDHEHWY
ncbi:hypothetical protein D3C76_1713060 [compost metagenome]